jgi:outer membrane murein-binding lipoprotein Lpp
MRKGEVRVFGSQELGAKGSGGVVTAGPWNARDAYIAETAVTIDRLTAKIERLERREEALAKRVAELVENAQQANRFQSLAESLRNSRDYKLDEMVRLAKDLRARIESMEGPRTAYNGLTHKSFAAVDRKLNELSAVLVGEAGPVGRLHARALLAGAAAVVAGMLIAAVIV